MRRLPRLLFSVVLYLLATASLLVLIAAVTFWIRSHHVSEAWGAGVVRHPDASTTRLDDLRIWSAKGGVGIYFNRTWNPRYSAQDRAWTHQTDTMMEYPYASVVAAGIDETRYTLGPFVYQQARLGPAHLWMEINNSGRIPLAEREVNTTIVVPYWGIALAALPLPLWAIYRPLSRKHRARRRARAGLCARCGYDLRASPERCPECGAAPAR